MIFQINKSKPYFDPISLVAIHCCFICYCSIRWPVVLKFVTVSYPLVAQCNY